MFFLLIFFYKFISYKKLEEELFITFHIIFYKSYLIISYEKKQKTF
jgi:hypothetical protein